MTFYKDMQRWSFNLQIYFLNSRFSQVQKIHKEDKDVIQDRTMYEDAHIFAPNLHAMGLMTQEILKTIKVFLNSMNNFIPAPNLLIYLRSSVSNLVEQIQKEVVIMKTQSELIIYQD